MGLDMYLRVNHRKLAEKAKDIRFDYGYKVVAVEDGNTENVNYVYTCDEGGVEAVPIIHAAKLAAHKRTEDLAVYWRKDNQIHHWFVDHVMNGINDIREYPVSPEQLAELRDTCREVLVDRSKASQLLPTDYFWAFTGSSAYDEYYFEALEYTADILDLLLSSIKQDKKGNWHYAPDGVIRSKQNIKFSYSSWW